MAGNQDVVEVALIAWTADGAAPELVGRTRAPQAVECARQAILAERAGEFARISDLRSGAPGSTK